MAGQFGAASDTSGMVRLITEGFMTNAQQAMLLAVICLPIAAISIYVSARKARTPLERGFVLRWEPLLWGYLVGGLALAMYLPGMVPDLIYAIGLLFVVVAWRRKRTAMRRPEELRHQGSSQADAAV